MSDGMGRELAYLSSHATNRYFIPNWGINERFLGTIFGQAVGDALGLSTEFMSKQEVDRFYSNGIEDYSQIVQDDHRRRWQ